MRRDKELLCQELEYGPSREDEIMDDNPPELFTESHSKATEQAGDILDKYFDGWVLVTRIVSTEGKKDVIHYSFNNGQAEAIGLMELAKQTMIHNRFNNSDTSTE
jgi:hypothetical protein